MYVVGDFKRIGGKRRDRIAAVDARTGTGTPWRPGRVGIYEQDSVAVAPDGSRVYVAGGSGVVALDGRTGKHIWRTLNCCAGPVIVSRAGETLFAWGLIKGMRGESSEQALVALRASDGRILWKVESCCPEALLLSRDQRTLYVGGEYFYLGAFSAQTGEARPWKPHPDGYLGLESDAGVYTLASDPRSQAIYFGGSFSSVNGKPRRGAAAVDEAGNVLSWTAPTTGLICALALSPDSTSVFIGDGCSDRGRLLAVNAARS
jgi:outer membrane protein assembly factor BamB